MKKITQKQLNKIVNLHKLWLESNHIKGKQAIFETCELKDLIFDADLSNSVFKNCVIQNCYFLSIIISCSTFESVDLKDTGVRGDFNNSKFKDVSFYDCSTVFSDFSGCSLYEVKFLKCNLEYTIFSGSSMHFVTFNLSPMKATNFSNCLFNKDISVTNCDCNDVIMHNTQLDEIVFANSDISKTCFDKKDRFRKGMILSKPMIGYKKCFSNNENVNGEYVLVKLEIPKGAVVFCVNGHKCRTNKAKVLSITNLSDNNLTSAYSIFDSLFEYNINEIVEVSDFNLNCNLECASGIHFFKTEEEAWKY